MKLIWNWRGRHRIADAAIRVRTPKRASSWPGASSTGAAGSGAPPLVASHHTANAPTASSAASLTTASSAMVSTSPALSPGRSARREPNRIANSPISAATISTSSSAATCARRSGAISSRVVPTDCSWSAM